MIAYDEDFEEKLNLDAAGDAPKWSHDPVDPVIGWPDEPTYWWKQAEKDYGSPR